MEHTRPTCLGFIMDGNRRWAKEQKLSTLDGHQKGLDVFMEAVRFVRDEHIPHGVFYAFSTENWKRTEAEVSYLLSLFSGLLTRLSGGLEEEGVRVRFIGRQEDFSPELQQQMVDLEEKTSHYTATTVWIALSYGGRAEIIEAVNAAIKKGVEVDEGSFENLLWTAELPEPDMIVRTGGEERLSNFLTWKSVYSEFYFIEKQWPALTKDDFKDILLQYEKRQRRHGA